MLEILVLKSETQKRISVLPADSVAILRIEGGRVATFPGDRSQQNVEESPIKFPAHLCFGLVLNLLVELVQFCH